LRREGHYLGAHSDQHLLYCDWGKRDSLLVTRQQFVSDLLANYKAMERFGIERSAAPYFLPPYEWYNDSISAWTRQLGFQLINFTPGTLTHADYTTPSMKNYRSSDVILKSVYDSKNLNGFIMLMHIGAGPERKDKLHDRLGELIGWMKKKGYEIVPLHELF